MLILNADTTNPLLLVKDPSRMPDKKLIIGFPSHFQCTIRDDTTEHISLAFGYCHVWDLAELLA